MHERSQRRGEDKAARLPEWLYGQLLDHLARGQLAAGQRLPSEHALCTIFQVSRPVIREAIARLQAEGLVVTRHGAGSFVTERGDVSRVEADSVEFGRGMQFRMALEGEAAFLAAERRVDVGWAEVEARFSPRRPFAPSEAGDDRTFHLAIARASRNPFFEDALQRLPLFVWAGMAPASPGQRDGLADGRRLLDEDHRGILEAIRTRRPDLARLRMREHIARTAPAGLISHAETAGIVVAKHALP